MVYEVVEGSVEELLAVEPGDLGDEAARQHALALHRLAARVDAARVAAVGVVDRRSLHAADGGRSAAGWLAARVDQVRGRCAADVRLARSLDALPAVEVAARQGRLGRAKVDLIIEVCTSEVASLFAEHQAWLVDEVAQLTVADAARFLRAWHEQARLAEKAVDPDEPAEPAAPRVRVDLSPTFSGRWVLDGEMDAEHGTLLRRAIDTEVEEMFRVGVFQPDDGLTPGERRGLALAQVVARKARPATQHGAPRPSVEVVCDERTLAGRPVVDPSDDGGADLRSRVCELVDGTPVSTVTLGRLLCGADVHRIVVSAAGEVLDVGRDARLATRAQRRALRFRHHRHCAFPGCTAPMEWCEVHHLVEWEEGGPTDLANLVPLCSFHHHRVHEGGFALALAPDGTIRASRPPDATGRRCPVTATSSHRRTPAPRLAAPVASG